MCSPLLKVTARSYLGLNARFYNKSALRLPMTRTEFTADMWAEHKRYAGRHAVRDGLKYFDGTRWRSLSSWGMSGADLDG